MTNINAKDYLVIAIKSFVICIFFWLLSLLILPCIQASEEAGVTQRLEIWLDDFLWRSDKPQVRFPLRLRVDQVAGKWQHHFMADSYNHSTFNQGNHSGRIRELSVDSSAIAITAIVQVLNDPWTDYQDIGDLTLSATSSVPGTWQGTWRGTFRGVVATGVVRIRSIPIPGHPQGAAPYSSYPRLLLRSEDVPALRRTASTPWGITQITRLKSILSSPGRQGMDSKTDKAIAAGLLYVLTEDKGYARQSWLFLKEDIPNWYNVEMVHGEAVRITQATLAFDLIRTTLNQEDREEMLDLLRRKLPTLHYPSVGVFNPSHGSNWSAMYRSALGLAALTLLAEPTITPPTATGVIIRSPTPLAQTVANQAVVCPLLPGKAIDKWVAVGPFVAKPKDDPLASVGGEMNARLVIGEKVLDQPVFEIHEKARISAATAARFRRPRWEGGIDFVNVVGRAYFKSFAMQTMLEVHSEQMVIVDFLTTKMDRLTVTLAGQRIEPKQPLHLRPGYYPITVIGNISKAGDWEPLEWYLRFDPVDSDESKEVKEKQARIKNYEHAAQVIDRTYYGAGPWPDAQAQSWFLVALNALVNWDEGSFGDSGWNREGEAYTRYPLRLAAPFALAAKNAAGRGPFPINRGVSQSLKSYVVRSVISDQSAYFGSFGPGGGPVGVDTWARGWSLVSKSDRPVVAWAMEKTFDLAAAGRLTDPHDIWDQLDALDIAMLMVDPPDNVKAQDPDAFGLDKNLYDPVKGAWVFRNRYQDVNDSVVSFLLDSDARKVMGGWIAPESGDFRIRCAGHEFAVRGISFGNGASSRTIPDGQRRYGNVPFISGANLLSDEISPHGLAYSLNTDGSGMVTVDLSACHWTTSASSSGKKPGPKVATGICVIRTLGVDYSSRSGASMAVIIRDKVTNQGDRNVTWQFATDAAFQTNCDGQGFTIVAPSGASLRGTVLNVAKPLVKATPVSIRHEINYQKSHQQGNFKVNSITIDGSTEYVVVLTGQHGPVPTPVSRGPSKSQIGNLLIDWSGPEGITLTTAVSSDNTLTPP